MDNQRAALEAQVRECYGRAIYTHKTHEKMADGYDGKQKRIKFWQVVLATLTAGGATGVLFADAVWLPYATAAVSLLTVFLTGYAKDIDPGAEAQKHREAAADIWNIREGYLCLLADLCDLSLPPETARERRDALQQQLHQLYRSAPHTDGKAYKKAQSRLQKAEDMTFTDAELDKLLPEALRKVTATR